MTMQTYVDYEGREVEAAKIIKVGKPPGYELACVPLVHVRIEGGDDYHIVGDVFAPTFDMAKRAYMLILNDKEYSVLTVSNFNDAFTLRSSIGNAADFGVAIKPNVTYAKSGSSIEELGVSDSAISAPKLSVIEPRPTEPKINETVVEILEEALRRAKSGEFQDLAYVAVNGDGNPCTAFNVDNHAVTALAGLRILERDIMDLRIHLRADMLK
jgi:hypothetical protein